MSDGGKGSKARPFSVDRDTFNNNWDNIFKKEKVEDGKINNADQNRQDTLGSTERSTTDRSIGEIK